MTLIDVSQLFGALGDPTRRGVYEAVESTDGVTASTLAEGASVTRQAIVKHLQVLTEVGLLRAERSGREVRYFVRPQGWQPAVEWLERRELDWADRLQRLERSVRARKAD